jgi:hypothetical protein
VTDINTDRIQDRQTKTR